MYAQYNELQHFKMLLDDKIFVYCENERSANEFCNYLHTKGLSWHTGESMLNNSAYTNNLCYYGCFEGEATINNDWVLTCCPHEIVIFKGV